jgi:hypothetical protein
MYYTPLELRCTITRKLICYALSRKEWLCLYNLRYLEIPFELVQEDIALQRLCENFEVLDFTIQRLRPGRLLPFHRDTDRNAALNLRLMHEQSFTFFRPDEDLSEREAEQVDLIEVPYRTGHFVLINVSKRHSVVNVSGERLMFSVGFHKQHTYDQVRQFILEEKL